MQAGEDPEPGTVFVMVEETNTTLSAKHMELADANTAFDNVRIVGNTNRKALYQFVGSSMVRLRTASLSFDDDQWENCDRIAQAAKDDGQDHEETTPVVGRSLSYSDTFYSYLSSIEESYLEMDELDWEYFSMGSAACVLLLISTVSYAVGIDTDWLEELWQVTYDWAIEEINKYYETPGLMLKY